MTALVLCVACTFGAPPTAPSVAFDSVVSSLPLPPWPPYVANDPRILDWTLAFCLASRIDDRGRELSKPDIDPDRAAELRLANLRDFEDIARFLARLRLLEKDAPTGINWRRQRFVGVS